MESEAKPVTPKRRRRKIGLVDAIIFVVLAIIIIVLLKTLLGQLALKHEAAAARQVSDRVISDIAKQNGSDVHSLGNQKFQATYSARDLTQGFTAVKSHTTRKPAVDHQTVTNTKSGQNVSIIYKYPDKSPFFVRVISSRPKGSAKWQLAGISADTSETSLLKATD